MRLPLRILSDLHLGHPACRIESASDLRGLLEGAATVLFNGDTREELALKFRDRSEVLLGGLCALAQELGVNVNFLPGNHDPSWDGPGWVGIAEGRIVVTHGDAAVWNGSPWSREAFRRADEVRRLWRERPEAETDAGERIELAREISRALRPAWVPGGRKLWQRVLDAVSPPQRAMEILRVWAELPEISARFAERYFPRAEIVVLGHFHHQGLWLRRGRLVINTGAYQIPHRARWVEWDGRWLRTGLVVMRGGLSCLAEADGVWRLGKLEQQPEGEG